MFVTCKSLVCTSVLQYKIIFIFFAFVVCFYFDSVLNYHDIMFIIVSCDIELLCLF